MIQIPLISTVFSLLGLAQQPIIPSAPFSTDTWQALNSSVSGRLYTTSKSSDGGPCAGLSGYVNDRVNHQSSGRIESTSGLFERGTQARLDTCLAKQDNVTRYFIDVQNSEDVTAAFSFARHTNFPLITTNLPTDFCRTAATTSLALWTENMKEIKYVPRFFPSSSKGVKSVPAISFEIGTSRKGLVAFADSLQVTVVADTTSALVGGPDNLEGAGMSFLSPMFGLGMDNILEFEAVTPDGKVRKINHLENPDLWFALRGGGTGSFAVVLRITVRAHPKIKLQTLAASFEPSPSTTQALVEIASLNALKWAAEGWGGYIRGHDLTLTTPKLSPTEAEKSIKPLTDFLDTLNGEVASWTLAQHGSYLEFQEAVDQNVNVVTGAERALISRLIPHPIFANEVSRQDLIKAIVRGSRFVPSWSINLATPYKSDSPDNKGTSITPAIYDSVWNVVFQSDLTGKTTIHDRLLTYSAVSKIATFLRYITPKSGTHIAEADYSEPNHERAFWGENYERLLEIKKEYDPKNILTTWRGVGWEGQQSSSRFSCYTPSRMTWVRCDRSCR